MGLSSYGNPSLTLVLNTSFHQFWQENLHFWCSVLSPDTPFIKARASNSSWNETGITYVLIKQSWTEQQDTQDLTTPCTFILLHKRRSTSSTSSSYSTYMERSKLANTELTRNSGNNFESDQEKKPRDWQERNVGKQG